MKEKFFDLSIEIDKGPIVATAIHDGHEVREELIDRFNLDGSERLREEDPFTGELAREFGNHIIGLRSRFEVDLNRNEEKAVYQKPEDAWGLKVWKKPLSEDSLYRSMEEYRRFYEETEEKLETLIDAHGYVIIYDIHSYNHRRNGPLAPGANPKENPEVNIGTSGMNKELWEPVVERFKRSIRNYEYPGGTLDVRENVKFKGGYFMNRIHERFGDRACVMSVEFKKIFMDEWSGKVFSDKLNHLKTALKQSMPVVLHEARVNQKIPEIL